MQRLMSAMLFVLLAVSGAAADAIEGHYVEARTCQVYTGPCFANGEVGMSGKDAVMAWKIQSGNRAGVTLDGLSVALVVRASDTLGHQGFANAEQIRSIVLIDQRANSTQQDALVGFLKEQAPSATQHIVQVKATNIKMTLDVAKLTGDLNIEKFVSLKTRQARPDDCICSNESAYYPPLANLNGSVPGVTIEGEVTARSLGTRWSIPDSRTAYLGTFHVE